MAGGANNIEISPVNVLWEIKAIDQFDFSGLTGLDVKGKYWTMYLPDGTGYYVWGSDGFALDPAPVGLTSLAYVVTGDADTAGTLATAAQTAITAIVGFTATVDANVVTVNRDAFGAVTDAVDVDSGVAVTICRRGKEFNLGLLDGDVEFNFAPSNFIVQAHQSGVTPRAALFQGAETVETSTSLLETQFSQLKELYNVYGGIYNPGTEIFGVGTSKQGQNLLVDAARLKMRPVNAVDASADVVLMLAIPIPDSLVFSGENPRTLSVTWQGFVDDTYASNIVNIVAFGDVEQ